MAASPADIYKNEVDFTALGLQYPEFSRKYALMHPHYNRTKQVGCLGPLALSLTDRSQRFNYILWLQSVLDSTSEDYRDRYDPKREVMGLDIPFIVAQTTVFITPSSVDFTLTNPPFYSSESDLLSSAAAKSRPPFSACTGASIEMVTPGGEVAFIARLIEQSQNIGQRIQWYTSMLGKLSSVQVVVEKLREVGCGNYAVTEFVQGQRTRRWAVGWSWGDRRPSIDVARGIPNFPKHLLPFPSELSFEKEDSIDKLGVIIDNGLKGLDLRWEWRARISTGVGFAKGNVWSRQARRKRALTKTTGAAVDEREEEEIEEDSFGFKITLRQRATDAPGKITVLVRWLKGNDPVLFESFCGMVKRKADGR
ncbi:MAG: hypothetical protein Q9227_001584 [Pyrenula ochraceoflavens]